MRSPQVSRLTEGVGEPRRDPDVPQMTHPDPRPRYRLLDSLGKGGMGEVFLADDTQLGRRVAIKFLSELLESDETSRERLRREARSAAALDHPYICKVFEIAEIDGRTGIVMEHVSGETLHARLLRSPLSPKEALHIVLEVAEALEEAHKQRVIHRDLKPANVMVTEHGHVKVMDFGLAKQTPAPSSELAVTEAPLTDAGTRLGTPGYMSPEQLLGAEVDERSDIFSFGVVFYEVLAGVHPFTRASSSGTMSAILRETHAPVGQYARAAPLATGPTLDRLLAKDPGERYQSFTDIRQDLARLTADSSDLVAAAIASTSKEPGSGRTAYVGRETERHESRRLLERAISGQGALLLLGGEPGVGKTRLAEEILAEGRALGCVVLTGRCYEMEGTPPYIPWVEIVERSVRVVPNAAFREALGDAGPEVAKLVPELRQIFPDLPPPAELPPEQQRRYLFNNFLAFIERGARVTPHVMLVDDLHWADDSTLLMLAHLTAHLDDLPLLIVGTYRDVDLEVDRPFAKTLESLNRQRVVHKLALKRLADTGVGDMLQALSGQTPPPDLVAAVYHETEGNPFFVEEVFRHLHEEGKLFKDDGRWREDLSVKDLDVPEGIRLVVGRRIQRLSEEHRQLLTTAAIVGRSFDLKLMEAVGRGGPDADPDAVLTALEAAEEAKLIVTVSSGRVVRWEFAHGLIRQTLQNSLSLPRRQRAHLRVADALERLHASNLDRHAADLAHHLYQAGAAADPDKTVRYLTTAGIKALDAGAFDEALRELDEALSILADPESDVEGDARQVADLQYQKGQALRSLGRDDDAVAVWSHALDTYEQLSDPAAIARTAKAAYYAQAWGGHVEAAERTARRGLEALGPDARRERSELLALTAFGLAVTGQEGGTVMIDEAMQLATEVGDSALIGEVLHHQGWLHWCHMQPRAAQASGEQATASFRARSNLWDVADAGVYGAWTPFLMGDVEEAVNKSLELSALANRVGHVNAEWMANWLPPARDLMTEGQLETFEVHTHGDIEFSRRNQLGWRFYSHLMHGWGLFWRGEWTRARETWRDAVRFQPTGSYAKDMSASALYLADAYLGEPAVGQKVRDQAALLGQVGDEVSFGTWEGLPNTVESLALLGERLDAGGLYPLVRRGVETEVVVGLQLRLWQTTAAIAAACGERWAAAQEHFETALRQAHDLPHKIAQPEVRRWYAWMLIDRDQPGDAEKARTLLGEAVEMYQTVGMPKHVELAGRLAEQVRQGQP